MTILINPMGNLVRLSVSINGREIDLGTYTRAEAVSVWERLTTSAEELGAYIAGSQK